MFIFHVALSLDLLAVVGGTALYLWAARSKGEGANFAKLIGLLVIIISILSVGCTVYSASKMWRDMQNNPHCMCMGGGMEKGKMEHMTHQR